MRLSNNEPNVEETAPHACSSFMPGLSHHDWPAFVVRPFFLGNGGRGFVDGLRDRVCNVINNGTHSILPSGRARERAA